jgi:hypothetical protein
MLDTVSTPGTLQAMAPKYIWDPGRFYEQQQFDKNEMGDFSCAEPEVKRRMAITKAL